MAPGRSLAERRAARCGFTEAPPRVNTSKVAAPILTIPPGISPSALLASPVVMLSDCQALLSPTTGTIKLPPPGPEIMGPNQVTTDTDRDPYEYIDSSFMFKPQTDIVPNPCMQISEDQVVFHSNNEFDDEVRCPDQDLTVYTGELLTNVEGPDYTTVDEKSVVDTTLNLDEPLNEEDVVPTHLEGDQTGEFSTTGIGRSSDDGYNWRKYGQKQVKGSEYPRSYYKCTNPSCQVKKKVERSLDGQITEIIYKGSHNHVKPQPTRRSAFGSPYSTNEISDSAAGHGSSANTEDGSTWISSQPESKDNNSIDWRVDVLEGTSSASVVTELSDPLSIAHGKHTNMMSDNPEHSSTLNEDEDGTIQGSMSAVDDGDDENESKRRKKENCMIETNPASRAVCESRVVVQTVSDVDILDDGYRWRKYGQKIVKGNPNPRSYYKCTSPGCSVRKHVERASNDLKSVITTYEGKHNHEVPVARNSNHMSSGCNQQSSCSVPASMVLPGSIRSSKGELHGPDFVPRFDRKLELGNHHLKSSYVGCFTSDSKIGVSPCYEMKMAHLQPMPYASLGLNTGNIEARQVIPITNIMQDLPFPFPMGLQRPNLAIGGYDTNYARPMNPEFQSFLGGQNKENLRRFIRLPKQEQENASYNPRTDTLSNGSLYDQLPGRHP